MKRTGGYSQSLWLFVLGVVALSLLRIPVLYLYRVYHLIVIAILCLLLVQMLLRYTLRLSMLLVVVLTLCGWLMGLDETVMLPFNMIAGLSMVLLIGESGDRLYLRIALGCLAGALILTAGSAGLMVWRKESELLKAVQYGVQYEWPVLAAGLAGALSGGYLCTRKRG